MELPQPISLAIFAGFIFSIVVHECAHAIAAGRCGDDTAYLLGRITLNPIPHIDFFMSILLPALLLLQGLPPFGGARPVPVDMSRLRHPHRDMQIVALAGPVSNIILAIIFTLMLNIIPLVGMGNKDFAIGLATFLAGVVGANLILAIFNMVPIPPLDGSKVLAGFLSRDAAAWIYHPNAHQVGIGIILVIVLLRGFYFLAPIVHAVRDFMFDWLVYYI